MLFEEGEEAADRNLYPCETPSMDSNLLCKRLNQVGHTRLGYCIPRECSKAQMCLQKILHIISSVPRQESCADSQIGKLEFDGNVSGDAGGFCPDFNPRVGASAEEEDQESVALVENGGGGGNGLVDAVSVGGSVTEKCLDGDGENAKFSESPATATETDKYEVEEHMEKTLEHSNIAEFHIQRGDDRIGRFDENESEKTAEEEGKKEKLTGSSDGGSDDGIVETAPFRGAKCKSGGDCLGLLIEAARLILGDFGENEFETESTHEDHESNSELDAKEPSQLEQVISESHSSSGSKRKLEGNWMVMNLVRDIDDRSPLVRSKRGRSQVLPCRYKDSVLEPWRSQSLPSKVKVSRRQRRSRYRT